jgi:sugar phosphate isomerase/epimerase
VPSYKRAVISDEISQDLEVAAAMAKDYRLDALELRNVWDQRADQLDDSSIDRAKQILTAHGLEVAAIASPFYKSNIDSTAETAEHLEILRRSIRAGRLFGTSLIRAFTFWKDRPFTQAASDPTYTRLLDLFAEPTRIAESEGITLIVENEASTFIATGEQLARFLADIASPAVRGLWDPGNAYWDDLREQAYPVGYTALRGQIAHVHLKDAAVDHTTGKLAWVPLGKGQIDIAGQLAALEADGYSSYVSLETHYRPRKLPDELLRSPSGAVFSELGAQATSECLRNWDEMIAARGR